MKRQELTTGWTLSRVDGPLPAAPFAGAASTGAAIPAIVPGCVHTDLLAAGLIPDPHDGANESALAWIGRTAWRYSCSFAGPDLEPDERLDLVCDGLDTVATIVVNGTVIGRTANQHRGYRFDLRPCLVAGSNTLEITFDSALDYAERMSEQYGPLPHVNAHPYNTIRKMACNFGWDWGPDLVTAGIWRPIALERWSDARIVSVRPIAGVDGSGNGTLAVHVDVERATRGSSLSIDSLSIDADIAGTRTRVALAGGATSAVLNVTVLDPELWWPRGYGEQPLYPLRVDLAADETAPLDSFSTRIGFRSIHLDTTPDARGIPFTLSINGQPVFVKGVNWIPDDSFLTRITRADVAQRIGQATAAGVNLLRVWGGGIYESDNFYELADEAGVLVWQDFLFACAGYPEAEPLYSEIEAEARQAVTRLTPHPSLVIWNGGNEDIVAFAEWPGMRAAIGDRPWGDGYYNDLLPRIVAELDPSRPYSPNSPFSFGPFSSPNEQNLGTVHIWDVWNQKDYAHYRDWKPRFVAEFGFQGPPAWSTLARSVHDDPLTPDGVEMLVHQKADDGNTKLARGLEPHLPPPATIADWHWATQLSQARAIGFGIAHFRALQPYCMGSIIWQLNDCWPVVSWAVVDGDGHPKPAWFALRDVYADRLLTVQPRGAGISVVVINDAPTAWSGEVRLQRRSVSGEVLGEESVAFVAAARSAVELPVPAALLPRGIADAFEREVLTAETGDARRALWFAEEDIDGGLPTPDFGAVVLPQSGGYRVTITANAFLEDLSLFPDRLDPAASVDRALVTLFPGETAVFEVRSEASLDPALLSSAPVLRTANDLFGALVAER